MKFVRKHWFWILFLALLIALPLTLYFKGIATGTIIADEIALFVVGMVFRLTYFIANRRHSMSMDLMKELDFRRSGFK